MCRPIHICQKTELKSCWTVPLKRIFHYQPCLDGWLLNTGNGHRGQMGRWRHWFIQQSRRTLGSTWPHEHGCTGMHVDAQPHARGHTAHAYRYRLRAHRYMATFHLDTWSGRISYLFLDAIWFLNHQIWGQRPCGIWSWIWYQGIRSRWIWYRV